MNQTSGMAAEPLNTATNTGARMGLAPMKFRARPVGMDAAMTL
jgi:hypothetical protein